METLQKIALVFTILGAINWGLVGILDFNLVEFLFEDIDILRRIIYIVIEPYRKRLKKLYFCKVFLLIF